MIASEVMVANVCIIKIISSTQIH